LPLPGTCYCSNATDKKSEAGLERWYTHGIPATQEAEVGISWSEAGVGKSMRPYLKNKLKAKGLEYGSSGIEPA
jgi:hypothetical protein